MVKCVIIGCWNNAPNKTGLCLTHRRDSDVSSAEDAKRLSPEGVAARAEGIAQVDQVEQP